jgi:hypothetical protein
MDERSQWRSVRLICRFSEGSFYSFLGQRSSFTPAASFWRMPPSPPLQLRCRLLFRIRYQRNAEKKTIPSTADPRSHVVGDGRTYHSKSVEREPKDTPDNGKCLSHSSAEVTKIPRSRHTRQSHSRGLDNQFGDDLFNQHSVSFVSVTHHRGPQQLRTNGPLEREP